MTATGLQLESVQPQSGPTPCLWDSGSLQTHRTQPAFSAQETGMSDRVSTSITAAPKSRCSESPALSASLREDTGSGESSNYEETAAKFVHPLWTLDQN